MTARWWKYRARWRDPAGKVFENVFDVRGEHVGEAVGSVVYQIVSKDLGRIHQWELLALERVEAGAALDESWGGFQFGRRG